MMVQQPGESKSYEEIQDRFILLGIVMSIIAIFPFSILRLINNQYWLAATEFFICIALALIIAITRRGYDTNRRNALLATSYILGFLAALSIKGGNTIFWIFPVLTATYFLFPARKGLLINGLTVLLTLPYLYLNTALVDFLYIAPTLVLLCVFGYITGARSEFHTTQLTRLATRDVLTNTKNRRSLDDKLQEIIALYQRNPSPVSVMFLDLDHFKQINDTYGHKTGDKILQHFANVINHNIRETDGLYRFGGEEFILIAINTPLTFSGILAEFLRSCVELDPFLKKYHVKVSIGVAELQKDDDTDSFLRTADTALYQAKKAGRNVVFLAHRDINSKEYIYEPYHITTREHKNKKEFTTSDWRELSANAR